MCDSQRPLDGADSEEPIMDDIARATVDNAESDAMLIWFGFELDPETMGVPAIARIP